MIDDEHDDKSSNHPLPGNWWHCGCCFLKKNGTFLCVCVGGGGFANRWHLCVLLINTPSPNCLSDKMFCGTSVALCVCGLWTAACCLLLQRSECVKGWRTWATKHVWHLKLDNIPGRKTTEPCQTQCRQRYSCVADCDDNTHTHTHTHTHTDMVTHTS